MEKVMDFVMNGKKYEIFGTPETFESTASKVLEDQKPVQEFGESWTGVAWGPDDFLAKALAAYLNDTKSIDFVFVHPSFKKYKDARQRLIDVEGEKTPQFCFSTMGAITELQIVTKNRYRYYYEGDNAFCVDPEGCVLSSYDALVVNALAGDIANDNILWATPAGKELITEILEA